MSLRTVVAWAIGALVFVFSWLFRFNDPSGSYAGLTDDHFFYLVRGWQILFGDLPVRDFVDHGAPLYYYVGAAVQVLFGRGTLSELAFSTTMLALGAALTFWLAARAAGSMAAGLCGAAVHVLLAPRFYNYPKILAYACAIPLLWWFADRPSSRRRFALAAVTAVSFLFRHDHGVFIGVATVVLIAMLTAVPWRERIRHAALYVVVTGALLAPYLLFIQMNGGLRTYFEQASAWAERDRGRAPVVWPGLNDNPDGVSDAAAAGPLPQRAVATIRDNSIAWIYYLEIALPVIALAVLGLSRDAFRPGWPHAPAKLAMVALLGLVLDAGFLRSPLGARVADPSVPLAILVAWLLAAAVRMTFNRAALRPGLRPFAVPVRALVLVVTVPVLAVLAIAVTRDFYDRLDAASLVPRPMNGFARVEQLSEQLRREWDLETWRDRTDRLELFDVILYLNACTAPTDRVLVQAYIPQVLALARRGFAGGHADLRPGFFKTEEAQQLTVARLQRQSVPVMLLEGDASFSEFRQGFPIVTAYIDRYYRVAANRVFDGRFGTTLLVRRDREPQGTYEPLGWPCYAGSLAQP